MNPISRTLHQNGYRLTSQRKSIMNALTNMPRSVEDIYSYVKRTCKYRIDKVTIYRTLNCFTRLHIVNKIQFMNNTALYELRTEKDHHHHLVCNKCGRIKNIAMNENALLREVEKQSDFLVSSHSLEFFGLCGHCKRFI